MKFIEVNPNEIPNFRESHRGRVSYPILKSFLETGMKIAQLDRTGIQQRFQSLYSSLTAYIRNHNLPIKLFARGGEIYLARLDLDEEGNVELSIEEALAGHYDSTDTVVDPEDADPAQPITPEEVTNRFQEAKDYTR